MRAQAVDLVFRVAEATPAPLRRLIARLPAQPPSWLLARVLDRVVLPRLSEAAREGLRARVVLIELRDTGVRFALQLGARGFEVAAGQAQPALRIHAASRALWRLALGEDDAERLFFERALMMEGDTEFGLLVKNTLDAIGPLHA